MDPDVLLRSVDEARRASTERVQVFWIRTPSGRHVYRDRLMRKLREACVVPLVVDIDAFQNPNTVLPDLVRLIELEQETVKSRLEKCEDSESITFLLVARGELGVPQVSSPVVLPEWVPRVGGRTVECLIRDVETSLEGPINVDEIRISELRARIYRLERALIERASSVTGSNHNKGNRLLGIVRDVSDAGLGLGEFLRNAESVLLKVADPSAYRMSLKNDHGFMSMLLRASFRQPIQTIPRIGRALEDALGLTRENIDVTRGGIVALLLRSNQREELPRLWASDVIRTVLASYQLITAEAHADRYPRFPIVVTKSVSFDLRKALTRMAEDLEGLGSS